MAVSYSDEVFEDFWTTEQTHPSGETVEVDYPQGPSYVPFVDRDLRKEHAENGEESIGPDFYFTKDAVDSSFPRKEIWDDHRCVAIHIAVYLREGHTLAEAVGAADIDFDQFKDRYQSTHPKVHNFEAIIRAYIWGKLKGIRFRSRIIDELEPRPNVRRKIGFGTWNGKRRCPHQTTFNEAWNRRFTPEVRDFIENVVARVRRYALRGNSLLETTELLLPDERDETEELTKDQIRRIVNEMVGYMVPNFDFGREGPVDHDKNVFFKLLAHCALTSSSAHGGQEQFAWSQIDDDDPPSGRRVMQLVKGLSKDEMLQMYAEAVESVVDALDEHADLYDQPVPLAIDTTTIESDAEWKRVTPESIARPEFHKWSEQKKTDTKEYIEERDLQCLVGEDPEKIRHADFNSSEKREAAERICDVVKYVHGIKKDGDVIYAWGFAGAAIAYPTCALVYAMEPLAKKDEFEDHVRRFIERGQELVTVSEIYMDSAYAQTAVFNQFHYGHGFRMPDTFNIPYVMNMRENSDVTKAALKESGGKGTVTTSIDDNDQDITVVKDYATYSQENDVYGKTTLVALPKRDRENGGVVDVDDPVTDRVVFCCNRMDVDADNAHELLRGSSDDPHDRGYTNRWLIEIGFQKIKDFLPFTKASHSGARLFYTLYASLLFNIWMTVDRTIKKRRYEAVEELEGKDEDDGPDYASEPELSAKVLSAIVANYLRPIT